MLISGKVTLFVVDLQESVAFYTRILGLYLVEQKGNYWAIVSDGGLRVTLERQFYREPETTKQTPALSLGVAVTHLNPVLTRIKETGTIVTGMHETGDGRILTLSDPDGNKIFVREVGELEEKNEERGAR